MAGNMLNALGAEAMMAASPLLRSFYSKCGARGLGHAVLQQTGRIPKVPSLVMRTPGSGLCNDADQQALTETFHMQSLDSSGDH